jgi:glyoxylase-like metal-dependent hydrolase (beta-lactamase superfamily II)
MEIINLGTNIVNNYLIILDTSKILIDTGYKGDYTLFCEKLIKNNIELSSINYLFLTHAHDDHAGFLNEVIENTNATLIIHKDAVERLKIGHNLRIGGCSSIKAKIILSLLSSLGNSKQEFPIFEISKNTIIWDNDCQVFETMGIPLHIMHLPGHTSDSIGLLYKDDILFCGDASMNGPLSVNHNIVWIEDLENYKNTWNKMIGTKANVIYPSHGKQFEMKELIKNTKHLDKIKLYQL